MGERWATIDVGTNTVLLLVAERRGGLLAPVLERADITRLGRGVDGTGRLDPAAIGADDRDEAMTPTVLAATIDMSRGFGNCVTSTRVSLSSVSFVSRNSSVSLVAVSAPGLRHSNQ